MDSNYRGLSGLVAVLTRFVSNVIYLTDSFSNKVNMPANVFFPICYTVVHGVPNLSGDQIKTEDFTNKAKYLKK